MDEPPRTPDPRRSGGPGRARPRRAGDGAGVGVGAAVSGEPAVPLGRSERRRAKARKALGAPVVHEAIRREGEEELGRPLQAIGWSAVAAGLSMGFSFLGEAVLRSALPDVPWRPLVAKLGYSLGFLFVILGRQQLFTENTLVAILPLLARPGGRALARVAALWAVVLAGNVAGAAAFAASLSVDRLFSPELQRAFGELGEKAMTPGFLGVVGRGIYGGWLIALMVWLLPAARSARFLVIVTVTWLVGAAELSHVIAGSVEVLYLVAAGKLGLVAALGGFVLPAFLGNSIGGVALVAALNHAQVVAGASRGG
jgi:formate/nitrite transporter FocA (FNT family)